MQMNPHPCPVKPWSPVDPPTPAPMTPPWGTNTGHEQARPAPISQLHSVHPKLLFLHSSPCHKMTLPFPQLPKPITCRGSGLPSRLNYLSSTAKSHWLYLQICPEILHLIRPTPSYRLIWSSGNCFCAPCAPIGVHHSRAASVTFQRRHCPTSNPQRTFHLPPNKTQVPTLRQHIPDIFLPLPLHLQAFPCPTHITLAIHVCLLFLPQQANPPVSSRCVWLPVFCASLQASPPQIRW